MKRFFIILFYLTFSMVIESQTCKYINYSPYFEFEYPESYTEAEIVNAPHMVLKLQNNNRIINNCTLSIWNYGLDSNFDLWDDEFYYDYVQSSKSHSKLNMIDIKKTKLYINNKQIRTIESNIVDQLYIPGQKNPFKLYLVTYIMQYKGYILELCFVSTKKFNLTINARKQLSKGLTLFE